MTNGYLTARSTTIAVARALPASAAIDAAFLAAARKSGALALVTGLAYAVYHRKELGAIAESFIADLQGPDPSVDHAFDASLFIGTLPSDSQFQDEAIAAFLAADVAAQDEMSFAMPLALGMPWLDYQLPSVHRGAGLVPDPSWSLFASFPSPTFAESNGDAIDSFRFGHGDAYFLKTAASVVVSVYNDNAGNMNFPQDLSKDIGLTPYDYSGWKTAPLYSEYFGISYVGEMAIDTHGSYTRAWPKGNIWVIPGVPAVAPEQFDDDTGQPLISGAGSGSVSEPLAYFPPQTFPEAARAHDINVANDLLGSPRYRDLTVPRTAALTYYWAEGGKSVQDDSHVRHRNPPPRTKEKKVKTSRGAYRVLKWALDVSEWIDVVDAIFSTLPRKPKGLPPHQKALYIVQHWDELDPKDVVLAVIYNQMEDALVGFFGSLDGTGRQLLGLRPGDVWNMPSQFELAQALGFPDSGSSLQDIVYDFGNGLVAAAREG